MANTLTASDAVFYYGIAIGLFGVIAQFALTNKVKGKTKVDTSQLFMSIAVAGIATIVGIAAVNPE